MAHHTAHTARNTLPLPDDLDALLRRLSEVNQVTETGDEPEVDGEHQLPDPQHERQRLIEAIVETNLGMIRSIVRRIAHASSSSCADYEQDGVAALIEAAETFDPTRGSWSSWAYRKIHSSVLNALHAAEFQHLTHREFAQRPEAIRARAHLEQRLGRPVTAHDLALELGLHPEYADRLLSDVTATTTADLSAVPTNEEPLPENSDDMDYSLLEARELYVINRRHHLEPAPLREIAQELGISDEQVRRIERRAIAKLQRVGPD